MNYRAPVRSLIAIGVVAGLVIVPTALAVPASADPGGDPCQSGLNFFCKFIPTAPDLDHNIDLTQGQPPAGPAQQAPENQPPAPLCAFGCV